MTICLIGKSLATGHVHLPDYLRDPAVDSKQFRRDLNSWRCICSFTGRSKHYHIRGVYV